MNSSMGASKMSVGQLLVGKSGTLAKNKSYEMFDKSFKGNYVL